MLEADKCVKKENRIRGWARTYMLNKAIQCKHVKMRFKEMWR